MILKNNSDKIPSRDKVQKNSYKKKVLHIFLLLLGLNLLKSILWFFHFHSHFVGTKNFILFISTKISLVLSPSPMGFVLWQSAGEKKRRKAYNRLKWKCRIFSSAHKSLCLGDFNLKGWTFFTSMSFLSLLCVWDEAIRRRTERNFFIMEETLEHTQKKWDGSKSSDNFFLLFNFFITSFFLSLNTKFHACKTWISAKKE